MITESDMAYIARLQSEKKMRKKLTESDLMYIARLQSEGIWTDLTPEDLSHFRSDYIAELQEAEKKYPPGHPYWMGLKEDDPLYDYHLQVLESKIAVK